GHRSRIPGGDGPTAPAQGEKPRGQSRPRPTGGRDRQAGGDAPMTLLADRITRKFGGLTAVSNVTLELRPGEVHGLIGPNGSGKTTMLNLLSGYYRPHGGAIRLGGR